MNAHTGPQAPGLDEPRSTEATQERLRVEVAYGPAGGPMDLTLLSLPAGATLAQAIEASGVLGRHGLLAATLDVGVWGRRAALHTALRTDDRVEIYRPLQCDPKEARRLRYRSQGKQPPGSRHKPSRTPPR